MCNVRSIKSSGGQIIGFNFFLGVLCGISHARFPRSSRDVSCSRDKSQPLGLADFLLGAQQLSHQRLYYTLDPTKIDALLFFPIVVALDRLFIPFTGIWCMTINSTSACPPWKLQDGAWNYCFQALCPGNRWQGNKDKQIGSNDGQ